MEPLLKPPTPAGVILFARVAPPLPRCCVLVALVDVLAMGRRLASWGILRNSSVKGR